MDGIDDGSLLVATADLVVLASSGVPIPLTTLETTARRAERQLGTVAISQAHWKQFAFVEDPTPLEMENDLLSCALEIEQELVGDEKHFVNVLAEASQTSEMDVRRILCRWMDDRIAYVPSDALDDDREPFVLEDRAAIRLRKWSRYEKERERTRGFEFLIQTSRPFPNEAIKLVHGIGRELGIRFSEVTEGAKGFTVAGTLPDDIVRDQIASLRAKLTTTVQNTFSEIRRLELAAQSVSITNNTTYNNSGQVGAQGPNAVAMGNTFVQQLVDGEARGQHGGHPGLQAQLRRPPIKKHTILFLAAKPNGSDRLGLDREARSIQVELERSGYRDRFNFETRWAAEPLDPMPLS
jgi:hypothetical protein